MVPLGTQTCEIRGVLNFPYPLNCLTLGSPPKPKALSSLTILVDSKTRTLTLSLILMDLVFGLGLGLLGITFGKRLAFEVICQQNSFK